MKDKAYSRKILGCLFSLLFAAIIFVGFAPGEAKASDELMWWAERTTAEYGRSKLTEAQQVLWDELYGTLHDFTVVEGFEKDTWDDKSFIVNILPSFNTHSAKKPSTSGRILLTYRILPKQSKSTEPFL